MITQRARELHQHINTDGCAFMCVAYNVVKYRPEQWLLPTGLNKTYQVALEEGIMGERSFIKDWAGLFDLFGLHVEYLGHMSRNYRLKPDEFEILKWTLWVPHAGTTWQHFVTGDGKGHCEYDPWGSAGPMYHKSRTVTEGILESKRIFRLLGW